MREKSTLAKIFGNAMQKGEENKVDLSSSEAMFLYRNFTEKERNAVDKIFTVLTGKSFQSMSEDWLVGLVTEGSIVRHKEYGKGSVSRLTKNYIYVDFDGRQKIFPYPEAFKKEWLTLEVI